MSPHTGFQTLWVLYTNMELLNAQEDHFYLCMNTTHWPLCSAVNILYECDALQTPCLKAPFVVYFDQLSGAAHLKAGRNMRFCMQTLFTPYLLQNDAKT